MTTAVLALRLRPGVTLGPALRRAPLPVVTIALSTIAHGAVLVALLTGLLTITSEPPKTYVVNLVPAVAAVGVPEGRAETPRRVETPPPAPPAPRPPDLPARPVPSAPTAPPVPRDLPARELPSRDLPTRTRNLDLPDRAAVPRAPGLPKPGEKELPAVASAPSVPRPVPALPPSPAPPSPAVRREIPPPAASLPQGRPSGSAAGSGALTLSVGDFPHAWYLRAIERKIHDTWKQPMSSRENQEAVAAFEIGRDGQVRRVRIEKTSGDAVYDQAALRAIHDANPFPPLPEDFKESPLRVHLAFTYRG